MMFAVLGQGACMAILAGTIWDGGHAAGLVATVMLFLFNFFFGVGLLAIPWLCMSYPSSSSSSFIGSLLTFLQYPRSTLLSPFELAQLLWQQPLIVRKKTQIPFLRKANTSSGICTFLVVEITPVSISNIGYRTYIYFAGMYFPLDGLLRQL
jgi:hypothetical protein